VPAAQQHFEQTPLALTASNHARSFQGIGACSEDHDHAGNRSERHRSVTRDRQEMAVHNDLTTQVFTGKYRDRNGNGNGDWGHSKSGCGLKNGHACDTAALPGLSAESTSLCSSPFSLNHIKSSRSFVRRAAIGGLQRDVAD
jgi:hypothetical protein